MILVTGRDITHTYLDTWIAEEFFGWRWLAHIGRPMTNHPDYPKEIRVRRFHPPASLNSPEWQEYYRTRESAPATGDEPLDYVYCSSMGAAMPPPYHMSLDACREFEQEIEKRGLLAQYAEILADLPDGEFPLLIATPEQRCYAALKVIGSKYAERLDEEQEQGDDQATDGRP